MKDGDLCHEIWNPASLDAVHLAFLAAELQLIPGGQGPCVQALITAANIMDVEENRRRRDLLHSRRGPLLQRIPSNTAWYEVRFLQEQHIDQLLVIARCGWDHSDDVNELAKVALRKSISLCGSPADWHPPVLWGHEKSGPFTILEGNHRLVAYASARPRPSLRIPVYIGLSSAPCIWHLPDPMP